MVRDGGNLRGTLRVTEVVILQNGSPIVADAGAGSGGNTLITADNYFAFPGSVVDASSDLGIDGTVEVSTPDVAPPTRSPPCRHPTSTRLP